MKNLAKSFTPVGSLVRFAALIGACLTLSSCSSTSSTPPLSPGSGGSTSISYNTPEILATIAKQSTVTNAAAVMIMTTGSLVNNAAVTLSGPSLSLPLTFFSSASSGTTFIAYYYSANTWTYSGNQSYTMTVSYSGNNYQSTITSVGNVVFSPSSSGITISWAGGGNENTAFALGGSPYNNYTYGPNITSPYFIAKSGLGGYSAGNYNIAMNCDKTNISAFSGGAYLGSSFTASDQESTTY